MHPCEAVSLMLTDPGLGILVDRRIPSVQRPFPDALVQLGELRVSSDCPISAWLVRSAEGGSLPRSVESQGFGVQKRIMDRFYLPDASDEEVVCTLFEIVAAIYDDLSEAKENISVAKRLLELVSSDLSEGALVLDFGCGTGVAMDAVKHVSPKVALIGTDLSESMLSHARAKGERTIGIDAWRAAPPKVDAAFACFVIHYGVSRSDIELISKSLQKNRMFAANMFRMSDYRVREFDSVLRQNGLILLHRTQIGRDRESHLLSCYRKTE